MQYLGICNLVSCSLIIDNAESKVEKLNKSDRHSIRPNNFNSYIINQYSLPHTVNQMYNVITSQILQLPFITVFNKKTLSAEWKT